MQVVSSTQFRSQIPQILKTIEENEEPYFVKTRDRTGVFLSLKYWNSLQETLHLLASKKNADRLMQAKADTKAGKIEFHDLIEV